MSSSQTTYQISSRNPTCQNINDLSNDVLQHILSFLPTKEAVATSVLSERWRSLWTYVPVLDFQDSRRYCQIDETQIISVSELVSRALILNQVVSLDKFRLKCPMDYGSSGLDTWIVDAILRRNVREIDISTSVLSERWRFYWTYVPVVVFQDSRRYCQIDEKQRMTFSELVSRALIHNKVVSLDKFRLACSIDHGSSCLNTWIDDVIRRRNVREIDISISATEKSNFFKLPSCFFTIKNLKVLKLSDGILIDVPNGLSVSFPSLKILYLLWVAYANNESVSRLFRGCTVLEELVVDSRSKYKVRNLIISMPTLKTLFTICIGFQSRRLIIERIDY